MTDGIRCLTGQPLVGDALAYNIYVDEAGTSKREKVRIVASVVVDVNRKWREAEAALRTAFARVPPHYRDGFVFHAKSLWGDPAFRNGWSLEERLALIKSVASIPRELGIPFTIGKVRSDAPDAQATLDELEKIGIKKHQLQYIIAFTNSVARADFFLRHYGEPGEVGTVISEDIPEMKEKVRICIKRMQDEPRFILMDTVDRDKDDPVLHEMAISQVIDRVHFVGKEDGPLLQIADALAFAFRRWLSEETFGEEMVLAAVGEGAGREQIIWDHWQGHSSSALFRHGQGQIQRLFDPNLHHTIIDARSCD